MNTIYKNVQDVLIPFGLMLLFVRIYESIALAANPAVGISILGFELIGLGVDMVILALFVVAYAGASLLMPGKQMFTKLIFSSVFAVFALLSVGLSAYFQLLLYPLDKVIVSFSATEAFHIAYGSSQNLLREMLPFVAVLAVGGSVLWYAPKLKLSRMFVASFGAIAAFAAVWHVLPMKGANMDSRIGYYAAENRVSQLFRYNDNALFVTSSDTSLLAENVAKYRSLHPQRRFVSEQYPFLHEEDYGNDVLAPFFGNFERKPSVVFIIVESLASSICGPNAKNGSCTPYLDSLIGHSLYWENHYSTAERTFEVFPSSLGSLPYGNEGFTRLANMPNHFSLIKLLGRNGYHTSFHHPADFKIYFDNWWRFFSVQGIDEIFDIDAYGSIPGFNSKNGAPDELLFAQTDSCLRSRGASPSLNILLTTSMHEPYMIPDQQRREAAVGAKILADGSLSDTQKKIMLYNISRTAAVAYTDEQIGRFIEGYKSSPDFENTIFVIFGDHSAYNYDPHNQAEQYHVPLIIYSPLIKHPQRFSGISSHWDITPTLLCLLNNACGLSLPRYTHWLGGRLDTSSVQDAGKRIPFMSVSRVCKDYLRGNDYLSGQELYDYRNARLEKKSDESRRMELNDELANYMYLNQYVCVHNKLLPDSVYESFAGIKKTVKREAFALSDDVDATREFFEFEKAVFADTAISNYTARLRFKMKCEKTGLYEVPRLIVAGSDARSREQLCYQLEFLSREDLSPLASNEWQEIVVSQSTNILRNTADSIMLSVYLWNPSRTPIYYKDVHYELIGDYR